MAIQLRSIFDFQSQANWKSRTAFWRSLGLVHERASPIRCLTYAVITMAENIFYGIIWYCPSCLIFSYSLRTIAFIVLSMPHAVQSLYGPLQNILLSILFLMCKSNSQNRTASRHGACLSQYPRGLGKGSPFHNGLLFTANLIQSKHRVLGGNQTADLPPEYQTGRPMCRELVRRKHCQKHVTEYVPVAWQTFSHKQCSWAAS